MRHKGGARSAPPNENAQLVIMNNNNNNNKETARLSEQDKELVGLVAVGLTDDEIATQLQIPQHTVVNRIARLLVKLGAQDRVEIVLYAYSDPTMYQQMSTEAINRTTKTPQAHTTAVKWKAS